MKATELIKISLDSANGWLMSLLQEVRDAPLTAPTPKGGNHPLWIVGHVAHSEASLVSEFILGEANPLAKWNDLFGKGSQPKADASIYPPLAEVLAELEKARARTLQLLGSMSDEDLSKPSKAGPERAALFGTVGQCFSVISHHMTFHAGQLADARRALGRAPIFG